MSNNNPKIIASHSCFLSPPGGADLESGVDGPLSINGGVAFIDAGDIKRYSSMLIINSGELVVRGWTTYGILNPGNIPTLIGCQGNCTINTGGKITAVDNAGDEIDFYGDVDYSAPVVPFDAVVNPITYTRFGSFGGAGGETGGAGTFPGADSAIFGPGMNPTGHGGGGAGSTDGRNTTDVHDWGDSGDGGNSTAGLGPTGIWPALSNFSSAGVSAYGGEVGVGDSIGDGGSGGLRALSGGAIYLQIGGTANIDANSIDVTGSTGGNGGNGGYASTPVGSSIGGGGAGAGAGGSGGYGWIRYSNGTVNASAVNYSGGLGGTGGLGGIADPLSPFGAADGFPGSDGGVGSDGGSSIATY